MYPRWQDCVFSSQAFMARYPDFVVTPYEVGMARMVESLRPVMPQAR